MSSDGPPNGETPGLPAGKLTKENVMLLDFYEIFGVSPTVADKDIKVSDIKRAYRRFSLLFHPDKDPSDQARRAFEHISNAVETLVDPEKRREYDASRERGRHAARAAPTSRGGSGLGSSGVYPAPGDTVSQQHKERISRETQQAAKLAEAALLARERQQNEAEERRRRDKADADHAARALVSELTEAMHTPFAAMEEAMIRDWDVDDDVLAMKVRDVELLIETLQSLNHERSSRSDNARKRARGDIQDVSSGAS